MGLKTHNLDEILKSNMNVHEYKEITNYDDLLLYSKQYEHFSIRFDRFNDEKGLPFYTYDADINQNREEYFHQIIDEMNKLNCTLLCSNGHMYDNKLKFNFVIDIDENANFILEICTKKIPLRLMYQYKTTIIKGNLFQDKYTITNKDANIYDEEDITKIIDYVVIRKYKYLEGTIYSDKVGILHDNIVIWQTN